MELNKSICELIGEMEYLIGSECYNPNSYDGWNDIEGCDFRYPICVPNNAGEYTKIRGNINNSFLINKKGISPETIPFIKYKFGSNQLYIGKGLIKVLNFLEMRYNLDFCSLEEELKQKKG